MGLLARMKGVTPTKKPTDDILLVHAMLLMAGADGAIDDEEIATVEAFANTLAEHNANVAAARAKGLL